MLNTKNINTLPEYNDEDSSNEILFNPLIFRNNNKLELLHQDISKDFYTSTEISEDSYESFNQLVYDRELPLPECGPVQFIWNKDSMYTASSEIIIQALKMGYMPMLYVSANSDSGAPARADTKYASYDITTSIYLPLIYYDNIAGELCAFFDGASLISQLATPKKLISDSQRTSTTIPKKLKMLWDLYPYAIGVKSTGAVFYNENLLTNYQ